MRKLLFVLISFLTFNAHAQVAGKSSAVQILITVQDLKTESREFVNQLCEEIVKTPEARAQVTCAQITTYDLQNHKADQLKKQKSYDYHLEIIKLNADNNKIEIKTHILKPEDKDEQTLYSIYFTGSDQDHVQSFSRHFANVLKYHQNQFRLKIQLVHEYVGFSKTLEANAKNQVVDSKTKKPVTWKQAYNILRSEDMHVEAHMRAMIQLAGIMGFGVYKYYQNLVVNEEDFDYNSFSDKLNNTVFGTDGWVFDKNKELYNTGHALAGMIYYKVARAHGYSALKSFAITFGTSMFWEVVGEYKEKASINDQIITPIGGAVLGEVGYQIARAIRKKSNSFLSKIFASFFDPIGAANHLYDKFMGNRSTYMEDLSADQYAELSLYIASSPGSNPAKRIGFEAEIFNIPGYGKPGEASGVVLDTAAVEATMELTQSGLGQEEIKVLTTVAWMAYYKKKMTATQGYEYMISLSSGLDYNNRSTPYEDFDLNVHVLGTQMKVTGLINGFKVSAGFDLFGDFVMMNSLAIKEYDKVDPTRAGLQSVVKYQGYYYGWGLTARLRLAVSHGRYTAFVDHTETAVNSINSRDRFQADVTNNFKYKDGKQSQSVGLSVMMTKNLKVTIKNERVLRESSISNGMSASKSFNRRWIELHYIW